MAEFLTTKGTSHHIENIIIEAKASLILVSPYLQLSKTFFERLKDAANKGIKIKIIYGKDELKPNERNSLAELKNIELLYFQNLHAKCYFNETKMVITSMNMFQFSEVNNREMGILIDRTADKSIFEKAVDEVKSIIQSSEIIALKKVERKFPATNPTDLKVKKDSTVAYCIRCATRIPFNPTKPLCLSCYTSWAEYENEEYEENNCHACGEYEDTSMSRPLCYKCYKKLNK
jgi:HKD family nuclease